MGAFLHVHAVGSLEPPALTDTPDDQQKRNQQYGKSS
jgi:hypothetical protein